MGVYQFDPEPYPHFRFLCEHGLSSPLIQVYTFAFNKHSLVHDAARDRAELPSAMWSNMLTYLTGYPGAALCHPGPHARALVPDCLALVILNLQI